MEDKTTLEEKLGEEQKERIMQQILPDSIPLIYSYDGIKIIAYESRKEIDYWHSYRNVTDMKNLPLFFSHEDADFPKGLYGTYVPLTDVVTIANHTRADIEQRMITKVHEYMLHRNAKLDDGYVLMALEAWIASEREKPKYRR